MRFSPACPLVLYYNQEAVAPGEAFSSPQKARSGLSRSSTTQYGLEKGSEATKAVIHDSEQDTHPGDDLGAAQTRLDSRVMAREERDRQQSK